MLSVALAMMDERFHTGVSLFNAHDFFECHDVWEDLWMDTTGPDKLFYQGLIQAAVAYYHALSDNPRGASHQFGKALDKLSRFPAIHHGIDCGHLCSVLARHNDEFLRILAGEAVIFDDSTIPTISILT